MKNLKFVSEGCKLQPAKDNEALNLVVVTTVLITAYILRGYK